MGETTPKFAYLTFECIIYWHSGFHPSANMYKFQIDIIVKCGDIYFVYFHLGKGSKKNKKNYGKFHFRGGGGRSAGVIFHKHFFKNFFAPNCLKIILRHWSFFMYRGGGSPLGAPQVPPRLHRYILRCQNHVKAKIERVVDKISV